MLLLIDPDFRRDKNCLHALRLRWLLLLRDLHNGPGIGIGFDTNGFFGSVGPGTSYIRASLKNGVLTWTGLNPDILSCPDCAKRQKRTMQKQDKPCQGLVFCFTWTSHELIQHGLPTLSLYV